MALNDSTKAAVRELFSQLESGTSYHASSYLGAGFEELDQCGVRFAPGQVLAITGDVDATRIVCGALMRQLIEREQRWVHGCFESSARERVLELAMKLEPRLTGLRSRVPSEGDWRALIAAGGQLSEDLVMVCATDLDFDAWLKRFTWTISEHAARVAVIDSLELASSWIERDRQVVRLMGALTRLAISEEITIVIGAGSSPMIEGSSLASTVLETHITPPRAPDELFPTLRLDVVRDRFGGTGSAEFTLDARTGTLCSCSGTPASAAEDIIRSTAMGSTEDVSIRRAKWACDHAHERVRCQRRRDALSSLQAARDRSVDWHTHVGRSDRHPTQGAPRRQHRDDTTRARGVVLRRRLRARKPRRRP